MRIAIVLTKSFFGVKGEIAIGILLTILSTLPYIEATLVSQISRSGMLFANYRLGCLVSAFSIAALEYICGCSFVGATLNK